MSVLQHNKVVQKTLQIKEQRIAHGVSGQRFLELVMSAVAKR
jgi:hypothetical protein